MLGKETIYTNSYNRTYGSRGSYSTNQQVYGRDILSHPEIALTEDGGAKPFVHGAAPHAKAAITFEIMEGKEPEKNEETVNT